MKNADFRARSTALSLALAAAFPFASTAAFAQATPALKESVVTATRSETRTDELVSEVVVIDRQAIEQSTARTVPELLSRVAGLQMSANGGAGKTSSVYIRGTEARHTILLVDGVRYGSATAGTPIWDVVPVESIERIEVLKGPASALYGSEGVGGVVQIFTRKGYAGFHPYASATLGSQRYRQATAGVSGAEGAVNYAIGALSTRERGFSSTNPNVQFGNFNADNDPFNQDSLNASLGFQINPGWRIDGGLVYSDGVTHIDDGAGRDAQTAVRSTVAHVGIKGKLSGIWSTELTYAQSADVSDALVAATLPTDFKTEQDQLTWQNNIDTPIGVALLGAEHRVQKVTGSTAYTVKDRTIDAWFAGINGSRDAHSWQFNLRHDSNSQFGGSNTGFAGYGYRISPQWRANISHGTTFVAPSFNQLYFPGFGNAALLPERGRNTDVGVTWSAGGQEVKLVRFDNRIRGYITNTTLPVNVPQTRIDGWTLGYEGRFDRLALRASYDALDPRNRLNNLILARRARSQATLGADYGLGAWRFGGSVLSVGSRFDDAANTRVLASYATLDLYADYAVGKDWSVQGKVNNLSNKTYETAYGYNQPGRAVYVTLRYQPK